MVLLLPALLAENATILGLQIAHSKEKTKATMKVPAKH